MSRTGTPSKLRRTVSQMITSPFSSVGRSSCKEKSRSRLVSDNRGGDADSVSQSGSENSFTPIRNNFSTISLV